jgi:hypothetical protein
MKHTELTIPNGTTTMSSFNNLSINPKQWTVEQVKEFIAYSIDNTIAEKFFKEKINGAAMFLLNLEILFYIMNIKVGPSLKILNEIANLRERVAQFC